MRVLLKIFKDHLLRTVNHTLKLPPGEYICVITDTNIRQDFEGNLTMELSVRIDADQVQIEESK